MAAPAPAPARAEVLPPVVPDVVRRAEDPAELAERAAEREELRRAASAATAETAVLEKRLAALEHECAEQRALVHAGLAREREAEIAARGHAEHVAQLEERYKQELAQVSAAARATRDAEASTRAAREAELEAKLAEAEADLQQAFESSNTVTQKNAELRVETKLLARQISALLEKLAEEKQKSAPFSALMRNDSTDYPAPAAAAGELHGHAAGTGAVALVQGGVLATAVPLANGGASPAAAPQRASVANPQGVALKLRRRDPHAPANVVPSANGDGARAHAVSLADNGHGGAAPAHAAPARAAAISEDEPAAEQPIWRMPPAAQPGAPRNSIMKRISRTLSWDSSQKARREREKASRDAFVRGANP